MILVTGASEGIGFECARHLLERTTTRVQITGRSMEKLARARTDLPAALRERLMTRVCDQGNAGAVDALLGALAADDEPLEGAILAVGANPVHTEGPRKLHALDPATIESTIRTNCIHTALVAARVLERLARQRSGVLVFIGSQAANVGMPGAAIYSATKSFLSGLARAVAREYAGRGVRVHLLHPGLVRTPRTAAIAGRFAEEHGAQVVEASDVAGRIVEIFVAGAATPVEVDL